METIRTAINAINTVTTTLELDGLCTSKLLGSHHIIMSRRIVKNGKNEMTIVDIKPDPRREDRLYNDSDFKKGIPRGLVLVFINGIRVHTTYGLTKFGDFGDYDDTKYARDLDLFAEPGRYLTILNTKENGQCGHVSGFIYNGVKYLIIRSKNVSVVVRLSHAEEDLANYIGDSYLFAIKIARELIAQGYDLNRIVNYCNKTGNTLCMEVHLGDHQHLVSYGNNAKFFFFAITNSLRDGQITTDAVSHPRELLDALRKLGLPTVSEMWIARTPFEVEQYKHHFATQSNSEGAVVVVYDTKTNRVVCRYKLKNPEYIIWRAVRELLKKDDVTLEDVVKRLITLHTDHPEVRTYVSEGEFTEYCMETQRFVAYFLSLAPEARVNFSDNWVTHRQEFAMVTRDYQDSLLAHHIAVAKTLDIKNIVNVIMMVGFPGSGKSTVARFLSKLLGCPYLEQDMFGNAKDYNKAIVTTMKDSTTKWLVLSKSHHNVQTRQAVFDALSQSGRPFTVQIMVLMVDDDIDKTAKLCIKRVLARGNAHKTIINCDEKKVSDIVTKTFANQFTFPIDTESPKIDAIHSVEIDSPTDAVINDVCSRLGLELITTDTMDKILSDIAIEDDALRSKNSGGFAGGAGGSTGGAGSVRKVVYDSLDVPMTGYEVLDLLKERGIILPLSENLKTQDTRRHITLEYFGGKPETTVHGFTDGVSHTIKLTEVRWDNKGCAVSVDLGDANRMFNNGGKQPHITIALADGVRPAYSAELFTKPIGRPFLAKRMSLGVEKHPSAFTPSPRRSASPTIGEMIERDGVMFIHFETPIIINVTTQRVFG